jgi:PAS domain S-box-containing protein
MVRELRFLLIEDDEDHINLITRALEREFDCRVDVARHGEEGILLCEQRSYACILLDFGLPGMSGLEILHELSKRGAPPPIIMLTGHGSEEIAVQAMKKGAFHYLDKTNLIFGLRRLLELVRKAALSGDVESLLGPGEERFRTLARISNDVIFRVDRNRRWRFYNQQIFHYLGYTAEELAQSAMDAHIHPDDRNRTRALLKRALTDGDPVAGFENRLLRKDGRSIRIVWNVIPERDERGEILCVLCVGHVVEEQRTLARELTSARECLLNLNGLLGELARGRLTWRSIGNTLSGLMRQVSSQAAMIHLREEGDLYRRRLSRGRYRALQQIESFRLGEGDLGELVVQPRATLRTVRTPGGSRGASAPRVLGAPIEPGASPRGLISLWLQRPDLPVFEVLPLLLDQLAQIVNGGLISGQVR